MARPKRSDQIQFEADLSCDDRIVHVDAVKEARLALPVRGELGALAELFASLGDPTRLRIVAALDARELCVCDIAATLGLSESAVSHQLRTLRALGLVRSRRQGRLVFYRLDDDHVAVLFRQGLDHIAHHGEVRA